MEISLELVVAVNQREQCSNPAAHPNPRPLHDQYAEMPR